MDEFKKWLNKVFWQNPTSEAVDLAKDAWKAALKSKTDDGAHVLCIAGLSDAVFTEEYGVLILRTPEGWLLWHSYKVDGITLAELVKDANENLIKSKETQDR